MKTLFSLITTALCFLASLAAEEPPSHFLSVIIPCYNCTATLRQSIDSIYTQQLRTPFELICTDDGSTDNTLNLLLEIQKEHPDMKVYRHERNRGGGPTRNTCVEHSQGDLIFCLDSDNVLSGPESLQQLIDFLDREKVDVACFGSLYFFKGKFKRSGRWDFATSTGRYNVFNMLTNGASPPNSGNYLYTRKSFDAVGGYSDQYVLDTFYFGFEQAYHGFEIAYLPGTFYWHRVSENGYYLRNLKNNKLDREFISIVSRHPELFTSETLHFLNESAKNGKFTNGMSYGEIQDSKTLQFNEELRKLLSSKTN